MTQRKEIITTDCSSTLFNKQDNSIETKLNDTISEVTIVIDPCVFFINTAYTKDPNNSDYPIQINPLIYEWVGNIKIMHPNIRFYFLKKFNIPYYEAGITIDIQDKSFLITLPSIFKKNLLSTESMHYIKNLNNDNIIKYVNLYPPSSTCLINYSDITKENIHKIPLDNELIIITNDIFLANVFNDKNKKVTVINLDTLYYPIVIPNIKLNPNEVDVRIDLDGTLFDPDILNLVNHFSIKEAYTHVNKRSLDKENYYQFSKQINPLLYINNIKKPVYLTKPKTVEFLKQNHLANVKLITQRKLTTNNQNLFYEKDPTFVFVSNLIKFYKNDSITINIDKNCFLGCSNYKIDAIYLEKKGQVNEGITIPKYTFLLDDKPEEISQCLQRTSHFKELGTQIVAGLILHPIYFSNNWMYRMATEHPDLYQDVLDVRNQEMNKLNEGFNLFIQKNNSHNTTVAESITDDFLNQVNSYCPIS